MLSPYPFILLIYTKDKQDGGILFVSYFNILMWLQGSTFPAINAILAHWVPPQQRGILGSFVFAGEFWFVRTTFYNLQMCILSK
jgi:hypothetical protein